ncbi:two-component sensor histidine kinase [Streptomyces sp. NBRC 14336]|uniref:sensor histidine kinase n=1 Tax=Streptomyces sp. NBRC 14336 TaxID=3030992 RepID=UPI0024A3D6FF|nr:histidine kinase [Streptomyces sp. NBRC 14336]WBO75711.1 histidine kinase [Streptomyces sp. SBE_14.2]GLW49481.1 two-component sensor histidine kinase [Streptomyces sp. NBRC 14336]
MLRDDLRTLWTEPRPPDPPARVWRDWALLAVSLAGVALEATLRDNVVWRPVAVVFAVWLCLLLLWRRTRPLAMVKLAFGSVILLQLASLVAAPDEPVGLDTNVVVLVLVYALARWGSGREIVLGGAVILAACTLATLTYEDPVVEEIGGLVFLLLPGVVGAAVRFRVTARERLLGQVRSREREQLARELHDTVAHHVSAMVIRAQAGRVLAGTDPSAAVEALEEVEEEGARTLEEMRAMVATLRDRGVGAELAPPAGVADLERLVRTPGGRLRVDLGLEGELDALPPAVDAAVYRIVQESVTNAMRHAVDATELVVRVVAERHTVRVSVRDNGRRTGRGRDGYGLTGLRERATLLGGTLRAGPGTDRGWHVEAELPTARSESGVHSRPRR